MKIIQIKQHLDFLESEMKDWNDYSSLTWNEYSADRKKRREVERWIENLINSSIDMAKLVLYLKEISLPESYTKIVAALDLVEPFSPHGKGLSKWVKLRNVITHEYLDIRWESIKDFIKEAKPLYEKFLGKPKEFIDKETRDEAIT
ncbi:MAG: DUF86 domain-containing protein [Nitrospinae bacterium]|nr:DUF86 domain-containing protein [Nitrospinota bacterium]